MIKKKKLGKVLDRIQGYHIRMIPQYQGKRMVTSTIGIYRGKKLLQKGFKNVEQAKETIEGGLI